MRSFTPSLFTPALSWPLNFIRRSYLVREEVYDLLICSFIECRKFIRSPHQQIIKCFFSPFTLAFRVSDCYHGAGKSKQTLPRLVIQCQQQMRFFAMHQTKAEKRFLTALLPVIPYGIDDLHLIQLSDRDHIVSKILIPDDYVDRAHCLP